MSLHEALDHLGRKLNAISSKRDAAQEGSHDKLQLKFGMIEEVVVKLIKDEHSEPKVRGFTVIQDEPESIGGTNQGPIPTDNFIASVGFCENVIFVRNASLAGLSLDSLETTVTESCDRRELFEIDNIAPYFNSITVETKVSTRDPVERVVDVARETHRRCPIHATLSRATQITFQLVVNGQSVPI